MEESIIKPITREAMLPAIDYKELTDPSISALKDFQIHDILIHIAYLRQNSINFKTLEEMHDRMPNLYSRADALISFKNNTGYFERALKQHKENLVLTKYNKDGRLNKTYQAGEVVSKLRKLYSEGYSLCSVVLNRECIGLYTAAMHTLGRFSLSHSKGKKCSIRLDAKRDDWFRIASKEFTYAANLSTVLLITGIKPIVTICEDRDYKESLLNYVINYLEDNKVIPENIVKELRKQFSGKGEFELKERLVSLSVPSRLRSEDLGLYHKLFNSKGFDDLGERRFVSKAKLKSLDQRCEEAFVKLYTRSRRSILQDSQSQDYWYAGLIKKYGNFYDSLIDFYGLRNTKFTNNDLVNATVDTRKLAEELSLTEKDFYTIAEKINLPLAERETRSFKYVHVDNAKILLEKVRAKFSYYESRRAA